MTDLTTRLAELKAVAEKATPGPWHLGDRWHIQGAKFCTCAERHGPLIREQLMDINGEMMLAHVHEGAQSWYPHGIMTEPWEDGHPRSVVYTTSEYGHPAREDEEHIATFDPPTVLALIAAVEGVVREHHAEPYAQGPDYCAECEHRWPCPTVQAITDALGGGRVSGIGDFFKSGAEALVDLAVEVVTLPETIAQAIADKAADNNQEGERQ